MMPRNKAGRYQILFGAVGTIDAEGKALRHALGDLVDLTETEAERLLGLGAVADTKGVAEKNISAPPGAPSQETPGLALGGGPPSPVDAAPDQLPS